MQIFFNSLSLNQYNTNFKAKRQIIKTLAEQTPKLSEAKIKRSARDKQIQELLMQGFSKSKIAELLSIGLTTVYKALENFPLKPTNVTRNERIISKLKKGLTVEQIEKEEFTSKTIIISIARKSNIKYLTESKIRKNERDNQIIEELLQGKSYGEISKEFGLSKDTIKDIAIKNNNPQKQFKEDRQLRIIEKIKQGLPVEQIAEEENLKISTIKVYQQRAWSTGLLEKEDFLKKIEERNKRIVEYAKNDMSVEDIAEKEGLSIHTIRTILLRGKIKPFTSLQQKRKAKKLKIIEMLLQGIPRSEIAKEFGVSKRRIDCIAEAHNTYRTRYNQKIARVKEKFKAGISIKEIAKEEGVSEMTISRYLAK